MNYTIAIQCHNFQRRLTWMLSSLLQQEGNPHITIDVAFLEGNGTPTTRSVLDTFDSLILFSKKNIKIVPRPYTKDQLHTFNHRGLIRNDQLKDCKTEWMLFSDSDMVYAPTFFERLSQELKVFHSTATYMLTTGRMSGDKDKFNKLVNQHAYPQVIRNSFAECVSLGKKQMRNVGAGFFQLVNMTHAAHGGLYVMPDLCRDWSMMEKGSNPKSDIQFRKRIGKRVPLPEWFSLNQIHLNHNRDPEAGTHITEQR